MSTASTKDGMDYAQLSLEEQRMELNRRAIPISAEAVFSFNSNSIINAGVNYPSSISKLANDGKTFMPHNNVGVNSPMGNRISNLTYDGRTSMPHNTNAASTDDVMCMDIIESPRAANKELGEFNPDYVPSINTTKNLHSNLLSVDEMNVSSLLPSADETTSSSPIISDPISDVHGNTTPPTNPKLFKLSNYGRISMPQKAFQNPTHRTVDELQVFNSTHKFLEFTLSSSCSTDDIINVLSLEEIESRNMTRLMSNQWTTIQGNNSVFFTTFHHSFPEEDARKAIQIFESDFKKSFNTPANFAGMESYGSPNTNTRFGIEARFWFNQITDGSDGLVGSLKKIISKNKSLASLFGCRPAPMAVGRYIVTNMTGVASRTLQQALTGDDVTASDINWSTRNWGPPIPKLERDSSSGESCSVTLTHLREGSKIPNEEFQIEVPTMIGTMTLITVKLAFFYTETPEMEKPTINKYKTQLCKSYEKHNFCRRGATCTFAHGETDRSEAPAPVVKHAPSFRTKMCRSVELNVACSRHRCTFAHTKNELVIVEQDTLISDQVACIMRGSQPVMDNCVEGTIRHDIPPVSNSTLVPPTDDTAVASAINIASNVEKLVEDSGEWTTVAGSNPVTQKMHAAASPRARSTNIFDHLDSGIPESPIFTPSEPAAQDTRVPADVLSFPNATTAVSSTLSLTEAGMSENTSLPASQPVFYTPLVASLVAIPQDSSKVLTSAVIMPQVEKHTHHLKIVKGNKNPFQCQRCKGTFSTEKYRCTAGITSAVCHYESCPACQKNTTHIADQPGLAPAHKITGKQNASTVACNIPPVNKPIMSDVSEVPTTPIAPVGSIKRKEISPSVNSPPFVGEDKSMRFMENAQASVLFTPAIIPTGDTLTIPSKPANAQRNDARSIPQTITQTQTSVLRKRQ